MSKFSKKPVFGPFWIHFPIILGKKIFPENPALSRTTSHGITCKISEKTNNTIPRKRLGRRMNEKSEVQTDPIL